jgi:hypothetical protein
MDLDGDMEEFAALNVDIPIFNAIQPYMFEPEADTNEDRRTFAEILANNASESDNSDDEERARIGNTYWFVDILNDDINNRTCCGIYIDL